MNWITTRRMMLLIMVASTVIGVNVLMMIMDSSKTAGKSIEMAHNQSTYHSEVEPACFSPVSSSLQPSNAQYWSLQVLLNQTQTMPGSVNPEKFEAAWSIRADQEEPLQIVERRVVDGPLATHVLFDFSNGVMTPDNEEQRIFFHRFWSTVFGSLLKTTGDSQNSNHRLSLSCNCECSQPKIKPGTPLDSKSDIDDLGKIFRCIQDNQNIKSTNVTVDKDTKADLWIVIRGQAADVTELLNLTSNSTPASKIAEDWYMRYELPFEDGDAILFIVVERDSSLIHNPELQEYLNDVATEYQKLAPKSLRSVNVYHFSIDDFSDGEISDSIKMLEGSLAKTAKGVELQVALPRLLTPDQIKQAKLNIQYPGCASTVVSGWTYNNVKQADGTVSLVIRYAPSIVVFFIVTASGLLLSLWLYRTNWFHMRSRLDGMWRFPWAE